MEQWSTKEQCRYFPSAQYEIARDKALKKLAQAAAAKREGRKQLKKRPASSTKRSPKVVIDLEDPSLTSAGDHPLNPIVLN
jgi:hypothetical protein